MSPRETVSNQRRPGGGYRHKTNKIQIFAREACRRSGPGPAKRADRRAGHGDGSRMRRSGQEIRIPKGTESLGRISAQTAKQVILQKVREAERETIYQRIQGSRRRTRELYRKTDRRAGYRLRPGQDGGAPAEERAIEARKLHCRRTRSLRNKERRKAGKNAGVIVSEPRRNS